MAIEDVVLVATVREDIRSRNLQVDAAEIPRRVEAARAVKSIHIDSADVSPAVSMSGAVEQASSSIDQGPAMEDRGTGEGVGVVFVSLVAGLKASADGINKNFQEIQAAPEDISGQREELQQPSEGRRAKATAKRNLEIENAWRIVEEAMLNADEGKIMKWKAEAEKSAAEEARVSDLKAKAEWADKTEREAEAARVVMLEAATELEKVVAGEVMRAASSVAKLARGEANKARGEVNKAKKAATKTKNR
jgi:hypothetical protein